MERATPPCIASQCKNEDRFLWQSRQYILGQVGWLQYQVILHMIQFSPPSLYLFASFILQWFSSIRLLLHLQSTCSSNKVSVSRWERRGGVTSARWSVAEVALPLPPAATLFAARFHLLVASPLRSQAWQIEVWLRLTLGNLIAN